MYVNLVNVLKRRLILELKNSFSFHPVYRKIVPFIQNRFAFDERPQMGIVVKGSSANKVQLSPNNYNGTINGHVMLAYVRQPTYPLEWIREDENIVRTRGMPTLPGVYYIEVMSAPTNPNEPGFFMLDPLLTQNQEAVLRFQTGLEQEAQLQQIPLRNTLRLYLNDRVLLKGGKDYTVDYATGAITLLTRFDRNDRLQADYRYAGTSLGPLPFFWNTTDFKTLPGVVLAFGKRAEAGNKIAIVVYQDPVQTAEVYGGKFEVTFDLSVIARDPTQMEEIADLAIMYLWGEKKDRLAMEGTEILDVNFSGEAEEPADETGDEYFYTASLSIQIRADWEIHKPLPLTISKVSATTKEGEPGIKQVQNNLFFATAPLLVRRNNQYERIT